MNVTVSVLVVESTDQVKWLRVKLSGSIKMPNPSVHVCLVTAGAPLTSANAVPVWNTTAVSKKTLSYGTAPNPWLNGLLVNVKAEYPSLSPRHLRENPRFDALDYSDLRLFRLGYFVKL